MFKVSPMNGKDKASKENKKLLRSSKVEKTRLDNPDLNNKGNPPWQGVLNSLNLLRGVGKLA